jgi:hypothetical protein
MTKFVHLIASQLCSVNQLLLSNHSATPPGIRLDARSIAQLSSGHCHETDIDFEQLYRSTNLETENRKGKPPQFMVAITSLVISKDHIHLSMALLIIAPLPYPSGPSYEIHI